MLCNWFIKNLFILLDFQQRSISSLPKQVKFLLEIDFFYMQKYSRHLVNGCALYNPKAYFLRLFKIKSCACKQLLYMAYECPCFNYAHCVARLTYAKTNKK